MGLLSTPNHSGLHTPNAVDLSWKRTTLIILAFIATYFIWGATYITNKWAVEAIPPFLMAGLRFFLAGSIMMGIAWFVQPVRITRRQWLHGTFAGLFLFVIGNGGMVWALQYLDSGFAALLASFQPIMIIILQRAIQRKTPHWMTMIGIFSGIAGMILLVGQPSFYLNPESVAALVVVLLAIASWAYISIWLPDADRPATPFHSAAVQMLTGGAILLLIAGIHGSWASFSPLDLSPKVWGSFVFLVVFGSVIAFTAFNYLLGEMPPEQVVTNTYVNPIVALWLGWWLNQETVTYQALLASMLLLGGVFLIHRRKARATS